MSEAESADLILVDAKYLLWRAATANPVEPVSLWLYYFLKAKELLIPDGLIIVCWDDDQNETFRRRWYPDYKKSRGQSRKIELARLVKRARCDTRKALQLLGVRQAIALYWEADDVIGTLIQRLGADREVLIFSVDKDFYQVLGPGVRMFNYKKDEFNFIDEAMAEAELGVPTQEVAKLKALAGDSSDGIPGIPGIGPVKGAKLLLEHDFDLKACAEACDFPYDQLRVYYRLVQINDKTQLRWIPSKKVDQKALAGEFLKMGLKSMLRDHRYKKLMAGELV